jgi:ribosomal protein L40E
MPSMTRFCPICGKARDGHAPSCAGCGHRFDQSPGAPVPAKNAGGAVERMASAVSTAQSAVSSAASAVHGVENLARMVLDGTPPPAWHVVIGETLPTVDQILAHKLVQAVQQEVVSAVQKKFVEQASPPVEEAVAGQPGSNAPPSAVERVNAHHFCDACGAEFNVDEQFCVQCGKPHNHEASTGAAAHARGSGSVCLRCNEAIAPGWKFCRKCGNQFAAP